MSTPTSTQSSRGHIAALTAAFLGWLFDGFEMGLFPLIGKPALQDLLPNATPLQQGQWFTVIIAVFLVGAATGGVLFGWLGDKLGRVKAMALAIFTFAIFTGLCAFVTKAEQFAALRFIASLGMGGEWSLGVALVNELWAGRNRAWIAGMIGAASNIGFLLTGILSLKLNASIETVTHALNSLGMGQDTADYLLHNRAWRFIAVSGALPALINFFILFSVPESHQWEEEKASGKTSHWATWDLLGVLLAAVAALVIIYVWSPLAQLGARLGDTAFVCQYNNIGMGSAFIITLIGLGIAMWGYLHPVRQYMSRSAASQTHATGEHTSVLRHLLLGAGLAAIALLGTWGSAQQAAKWASSLLPKSSTVPIIEYTVICTALGAILISLITPLIADKLGRRVTYTLLCLLSLCGAIAFFQTNHPFLDGQVSTWFFISAFLIGGLTASFYGFFPLYFPELFPTSVRATGQGFCFNFGRLIAAIGSLQLANLVKLFGTDANAYSILSCVYLIGMALIWFAPETKGQQLQ
jgi:MFS family permease